MVGTQYSSLEAVDPLPKASKESWTAPRAFGLAFRLQSDAHAVGPSTYTVHTQARK